MKSVAQSPSATPSLCWVWPHRVWRWGAGLSTGTRDVPATEEEDTWGTCTVRAWSLRPAAQSLMTNFQSVEEWSPSRGVVISRWSVQCDPVTCQPNHNLNHPPTNHCALHFSEKAKITRSSVSFTCQWFSNFVANSICMELISCILASGIFYWELINNNSYLGQPYTHKNCVCSSEQNWGLMMAFWKMCCPNLSRYPRAAEMLNMRSSILTSPSLSWSSDPLLFRLVVDRSRHQGTDPAPGVRQGQWGSDDIPAHGRPIKILAPWE